MSPACPQCGAPLRPGGRGGPCRRCLLRLAAPPAPSPAPSPDPELPGKLAGLLLHPGQVRDFGDYELLGEIARGGMGVVYRARQRSLNREVAVKMILAGQLATPEAVQRFRLEAEAAAHLHHPNIVPIHEVGEHETQHYFTMKLVEGGHLGQHLDRFGLPAVPASQRAARRERQREIARLLLKVANALSYAHQRGILHRDLKPSNLLIDAAGEPHLTDFGLARIMGRASGLTLSNAVLGSPAYMAPEQAAGKVDELTTAVDIYGLGALLYELLSGRPPHTGDTAVEVLRRVLDEETVPLAKRVPDVDRDLATICHRCLETLPERRYRSARAVAEELERFLRHEPIEARPAGVAERFGRWCRRRPAVAALGATAVLATFAGVLGVLWQWRAAEVSRRQAQAANRQLAAQLRRLEWQQAEEALAAGRTPDAMATFARFLRETPGDTVAAARLRSLFERRAFPLPLLPPLTHGKPVTLAQASGNEQTLFTLTSDGGLRSWNLADGTPGTEIRNDLADHVLRVLPDGNRLLVRTRAGRFQVWAASPGRLEHDLGESPPDNLSWGLSDDGQSLSLVTSNGVVQLWGTRDGRLLDQAPAPQPDLLVAGPLGPGGETLLRGRHQGLWLWRPATDSLQPLLDRAQPTKSAQIDWPRRRAYLCLGAENVDTNLLVSLDLASGKELVRTPAPRNWTLLQPFPDGNQLLVSVWGGGATVLEAGSLTPRFPWFGEAPCSANISPDPRFRAGFRALHDGTGRLYDLASGQSLMEPVQHAGAIGSHFLMADGRRLVTASQDGTAQLWDVRMRVEDPAWLEAGSWIHHFASSPDGSLLAAALEKEVRIYDTTTGALRSRTRASDDIVFHLAFSPDGRSIAATTGDRSACLLDASTGRVRWRATGYAARVFGVAFSPDGQTVAASSEDGTIRVLEAGTGRLRFPPLRHEGAVTSVRFNPDGRLLATTSIDATARLWDLATGQAFGAPFVHLGTVWSAEFTADGRRLLTASMDRTAQIWDVASGARVAPALRAEQGLRGAVFSPDGRRVLVHTLNGAVIFDSSTSRPLTPLMPHQGLVALASFSPDGRWVATASSDRTARVWDASTGFPLTEPLGYDGKITWFEWTRQPGQLLTSSQDGKVRRWTIPWMDSAPSWLPDLAEALAGRRTDPDNPDGGDSVGRLAALRQQALTNRVDDPQHRWLRWFLIERLAAAGGR